MAKRPTARKAAITKKRVIKPKTPTPSTARKATATKAPRTAEQPQAPATVVPRRAVFIDVENTSSEANLRNVFDHLKIDRQAQRTEVFALGNWRSVGARVARMLAGLGAQLVHSAPAPGVRDWSDLWIAVAAGRWLASAAPGDIIDIVSDDRAFDAVGDAAAAGGVVFRRTSYRTLSGGTERVAAVEPQARPQRHRGRGSRSHGAQRAQTTPPIATPAIPGRVTSPTPSSRDEEAHAASHEQIRAALTRLTGGGTQWINLDAIATALKAEGFVRPPGSPRLVTRLRKMKDVEVTPNGMVRLLAEGPVQAAEAAPPAPPPGVRRPRRRGGRRRRRSPASGNVASAPPVDAPA